MRHETIFKSQISEGGRCDEELLGTRYLVKQVERYKFVVQVAAAVTKREHMTTNLANGYCSRDIKGFADV